MSTYSSYKDILFLLYRKDSNAFFVQLWVPVYASDKSNQNQITITLLNKYLMTL